MIVPLFKVSNMADAIRHYTEVLDFVMTDPNDHADSPVVDLDRNGWNMQLTTTESEKLFGSVVYFWVEDVDALFVKYLERGLDTSHKAGSPVHQGPVNQTWGKREFYVTDADDNTVRFCQGI